MTSVYFWNLSSVTAFSAKQIVIALAKVAITDTKFMPLVADVTKKYEFIRNCVEMLIICNFLIKFGSTSPVGFLLPQKLNRSKNKLFWSTSSNGGKIFAFLQ